LRFRHTRIPDVTIVEIEPTVDERGFFARSWCREEFRARGLEAGLVQCNISYNRRRHTLRGMHYQAAPHEEVKLVRVTRGAAFDVALDLRSESPAYKKWVGVELDAENRRMLYIPGGVAHGFTTLEDDTELFYQMSHPYVAEAARGVRYDDPAFAIDWPGDNHRVSPRDRAFPDFSG
jgi:dTDP-4-dehydrorhamnose 3,5-epimerase